MAGEIYLSNLSGQFDYQSILDQLEQLKYVQANAIAQKEDKVLQQKSAFSTFASMLEDFKNDFETFADDELFDKKIVTVSDESIATVTLNDESKVEPTKLSFTVNQLATTDVWLSQAGPADDSDSVAREDGSFTISIGGEDYTVDYFEGDTIRDLAQHINDATDEVNASVFYDGSNYRLIVSSKETGTDNAIEIKDDTGELLDKLELGENYDDSHVQEAQNSIIDIYGETVESQNNVFSNVIDGVDIEVYKTSDTPVDVDISNDDEAVKTALENIFVKYNNLVDFAQEVTSPDGPLSGDITLHSIRSKIFDSFDPLMDKELIEVDHTNGHLSLNTEKFDELIKEDKDGLKEAFDEVEENLQPYLDYLFDPVDGLIDQKEESYDTKIDRYEEEISTTLERINEEMERLKMQFINLDTVLGELNSIQTQIGVLLTPTTTTIE
ncbi:MAG: flagellar filament capping protein FliD [Epsilonproteobacteria bacterium]|nr:flagellar filament capping protein FliD [Campylobacterota bacterium]